MLLLAIYTTLWASANCPQYFVIKMDYLMERCSHSTGERCEDDIRQELQKIKGDCLHWVPGGQFCASGDWFDWTETSGSAHHCPGLAGGSIIFSFSELTECLLVPGSVNIKWFEMTLSAYIHRQRKTEQPPWQTTCRRAALAQCGSTSAPCTSTSQRTCCGEYSSLLAG